MKNKIKDIVKLKKGSIKDLEIRVLQITKLLLLSIVFFDNKKYEIIKSYSFLEGNNTLDIEKFYKSLNYFKTLREEVVNTDFNVRSDEFFEVNCNDLLVLQIITEFTNYKFDYDIQKNHYEDFLLKNNLKELNDNIVSLNFYITILSKIFNLLDTNIFDISNGISTDFEDYVDKFKNKKISLNEILFGKSLKLENIILKIKMFSKEKNEKLFKKIRKLELEFYENEFLVQEDFLSFLYLIMENIKNIFSSTVVELINNIEYIWNQPRETKIENENNKDEETNLFNYDKNDGFLIEEFDDESESQKNQENDFSIDLEQEIKNMESNLDLKMEEYENTDINNDELFFDNKKNNEDDDVQNIDALINEMYANFDESSDDYILNNIDKEQNK